MSNGFHFLPIPLLPDSLLGGFKLEMAPGRGRATG